MNEEKNEKNKKEQDERFMKMAINQARIAFEAGEVPVGVIVVYKGKILFKSHNQVELLSDVTAHAEVIAVASAGEYTQSKYLKGCTLYVTLEPCAMCAGAIGWAQIARVVFGASDSQKGFQTTAPTALHAKCEISGGVLKEECQQLIYDFFAQKREK